MAFNRKKCNGSFDISYQTYSISFYLSLGINFDPPEISNYGAICLESMGYFHNATSPACIFTGNALEYVFFFAPNELNIAPNYLVIQIWESPACSLLRKSNLKWLNAYKLMSINLWTGRL